jgi:hypothetical protein
VSTDDPAALARQLRAMHLAWRLAEGGERGVLELEIRRLAGPRWREKLGRQVAAKIATDPAAEPLAQQVAQALLGAVARPDPVAVSASSAQVLIGGEGAQLGDVQTGDIAGGSIVKDNLIVVNIHVHGERPGE